MIKLPPDGSTWRVDNASDLRGHINYTYGINFDEDGYLKFTNKPVTIYSSSSNANFTLPLKILFYDLNNYFILTFTDCWTIGGDLAFTNITDGESNAPDPNQGSDAIVWQSRVYVSADTTTDIRYWNGTAWTDSTIALTDSNAVHPMAVMGNFANGYLAVGENNTVKLYNTSHSLITTVTLNNDYLVTSLLYRQNTLYIGTKAKNGGEAKLFVWNGSGTAAQNEYGVASDWIFAMTEYQSSFVIVTNKGQLLRWNGGGFNPLIDNTGREVVFPVYNTNYKWTRAVTGVRIGRVHMNGMVADGDRLYINIRGDVGYKQTVGSTGDADSFFLPEQPSGVWCFDPNIGLHCRTPHTQDGYTLFTALALSSNTLTLSANTNIQTGEPVEVLENGSLTGVDDDSIYYAIKVDTNQIKLALTQKDAEDGNAITLGGSVTSATFIIANYASNGNVFVRGLPGAIGLLVTDNSTPVAIPDYFNSPYLYGYEDSNSVERLCAETVVPGTGFFSTAKMSASGIKDNWNKIYTIVDVLFNTYDKIVYRYKIKEKLSFPTPPLTGTYSGADTIGSTDNRIDLAAVGDSVHIIDGAGAGNVRTIAAITGDEIRFTEALVGITSGNAVTFYIDSWQELPTRATKDTPTIPENYIDTAIGKSSAWIKFLIEGRGSVKIPGMRVVNKPFKETN